MTATELSQLNEDNYEYIKALNIIATELIHKGEILSDTRVQKNESVLVIKNDNIYYKLHMYCGDTCKSISWIHKKKED